MHFMRGKLIKRAGLLLTAALPVIAAMTIRHIHAAQAHHDAAHGVQISLASQLEEMGYRWEDMDGTQLDLLEILRNHGTDAVSLRVMPDPSFSGRWADADGGVHLLGQSDTASVTKMALRAQKAGFRLMIEIQYSDFYSVEEQRMSTAAWRDHDTLQLRSDVHGYTYEVMTALAQAGIYPEWVRIGTALQDGFLTDSEEDLTGLAGIAYDAVKQVSPDTKVVLPVSNVTDPDGVLDFLDRYFAGAGKADVIALCGITQEMLQEKDASPQIVELMNACAAVSGREVMLCDLQGNETDPEGAWQLIRGAVEAVEQVPDEKGIGVFYQEPEVHSKILPDHDTSGLTEMDGLFRIRFGEALNAYCYDAKPSDGSLWVMPEIRETEEMTESGQNGSRGTESETASQTEEPDGQTEVQTEAPEERIYYRITNVGSGLVLRAADGSFENLALIEQTVEAGYESQQWDLILRDDGYYVIKNRNSGLVMDITGGFSTPGVQCIQYEYHEGANQMWQLSQKDDGTYAIYNRGSGLCLTVEGGSTAEHAVCMQDNDIGARSQRWYIEMLLPEEETEMLSEALTEEMTEDLTEETLLETEETEEEIGETEEETAEEIGETLTETEEITETAGNLYETEEPEAMTETTAETEELPEETEEFMPAAEEIPAETEEELSETEALTETAEAFDTETEEDLYETEEMTEESLFEEESETETETETETER